MRTAFAVAFTACLLAVGLALVTSKKSAPTSTDISPQQLLRWFCDDDRGDCLDADRTSMAAVGERFLLRVAQSVWDYLPHIVKAAQNAKHPAEPKLSALLGHTRPSTLQQAVASFRETKLSSNGQYSYWGFMPEVEGTVIPGGPTLIYSSPCFESIAIDAEFIGPATVSVSLNASGQVSWFCTDYMLVFGVGALAFPEISEAQPYTFTLDFTSSMNDPARMWMLHNRGIRVTRFTKPFLDCILDVIPTVVLLAGFAESPLTKDTLMDNLQFIQNYIEFAPRMQPTSELRTSGAVVARKLDPSHIQSGDAFFIQRPDGLDPIIGWAEGGTPGHATIAMRDANDELHICESTTNDTYWPRNGIQCHKWEDWWPLAAGAQYNAVHLPLTPTQRQLFNVTAAWEWFHKTEGLDYGFSTMLFGWLDLPRANAPCLPPDFKVCFVDNTMEIIAIVIDDMLGNATRNLFRQGANHRIGTWPQQLTLVETIVYAAVNLNLTTFDSLYSIPENDEWDYMTTRNGVPTIGKSQVCNVFVCNMYKAGGLFQNIQNQINCGEQTLWGVFSMNLYDSNKTYGGRPKICQEIDPNNQLCQILGNFTFHLKPDFNTRTPYPWMGNYCPSQGPDYIRPAGC